MGISISARSSLAHGTRVFVIGGAIAGLVLLVGSEPAQAVSAKLYVANNGMDNADCGPEGKVPCRSISRAIAHANAGDQIIVGPGLYGDINRGGSVDPSGDSGEETPVSVPQFSLLGATANLALINIDKPVTIVSRAGAGATVIDAGGQFPANYIAVNAAVDGVVFGKKGKGFTIRNATVAVYIRNAAGVAVGGTIADTCNYGFVAGSPETGEMAEGTVLKGNVAGANSVLGFCVVDESAVVSGNLAKGSLMSGFLVAGSPGTAVTKNLAVDGLGYGFLVGPTGATGPTFSKNAAIGNMDAGVFVSVPGTVATAMTVKANSLYGNGKRPQYPPVNCGLVVQNAGTQPMTVNADGNYWGAASGPGGDPADAAGGGCTAGGPVTLNLAEWASKEIKVAPPVVK
jgi:hypothetical protein